MSKLLCYRHGSHLNQVQIASYFAVPDLATHLDPVRFRVLSGDLRFIGIHNQPLIFTQGQITPVVQEMSTYRIAHISADCLCQTEFHCLAEDYTHKKYGMTKTHSEVIAAAQIIAPGRVLDLGCGSGRNALYLQKLGFDVTAVDHSVTAITALKEIAAAERLEYFKPYQYDINRAELDEQYDWILSTVVMMFLHPDRITAIIDNMQHATKVNGFNLIVAAMSTPDCPCPLSFPYTFSSGTLLHYYQGWNILKYNENRGELHKRDVEGKRFKLRFATLLAQKSS